jgi:Fur family peroxide stress response transcriptional regulator
MRRDQIQARLAEFDAACLRQGTRRTTQRRIILEAVLSSEDHPTSDEVYQAVRPRIAGVSRTTVYRVLKTLVELGAVRQVHHSGGGVRFDGNTSRHHHLVCTRCNRVIDLEAPSLNQLPLPQASPGGFEIQDYSVHFVGTCGACRKRG